MRARLFSSVAASELGLRLLNRCALNQFLLHRYVQMIAIAAACSAVATAEDSSGYYTDPATGYVYRQVTRTIERPVVETVMRSREQTVYRPQTVTETKPETRTLYTPVVEYRWEPRLEGRWNPFRQPTVAYHHVPRTRWEARSEVVERTTKRTQWVAETRKIEVPERLTRIEREQKPDYELVGRIAPRATPNRADSEASAIASRLRPLDRTDRVAPLSGGASAVSGPSTLAGSTRRRASDSVARSAARGGMPATDLTPSARGTYSQPLPPLGSTVANLPAPPLWR